MINKVIDIVSASDKGRSKSILNIIKFLMTFLFTIFIYSAIFGEPKKPTEFSLNTIIKLLVSSNFLKGLILFFSIWHLFYSLISFLILIRALSLASRANSAFSNSQAQDIQTPPQTMPNFAYKKLYEMSLIRNIDNKVIAGASFYRIKKVVHQVVEGEVDMDITYFANILLVIFQAILMMWCIDIITGNVSILFNIIFTVLGMTIMYILYMVACFLLIIKMNAKPILDKMIEIENESERILNEHKEKKTETEKEQTALKESNKEALQNPDNNESESLEIKEKQEIIGEEKEEIINPA